MILSTHGFIASSIGQFVPLLDAYPNAAVAYSLDRLRTAYTGSAIRVRRASDNTEQDIGFVNNVLDTSSLTSFCSGTNGFVKTWYDQSGNGLDVSQTTAANQPQIVNSGSIILINSKPSIYFDTTNDILQRNSPNTEVLSMNEHSSAYVHYVPNTFDNVYITYARRQSGGNIPNYNPFGDGTTRVMRYWNGTTAATGTFVYQLNKQYLDNFIGNTSNLGKLYNNNILRTTQNIKIGDSNLTGTPIFTIGNWTGNEYTEKYIQEVVIWASDQTNVISSINTIINSRYGIY